jgi:hypothetical protein
MIIEYDVNCFERTLTIQCPDSYAGHEKKILELLDKYYDQWHNPEEIEDDEDREWVEGDACCEEYMMSKLTETYPECTEWDSIDYGDVEDEDEEPKKIALKIPFGELTAEIGGDPNYPTIYVYLKRPDGIEVDLVAVSMDQINTMIQAYIYERTDKDDYTENFCWREEQLNINYEEEN